MTDKPVTKETEPRGGLTPDAVENDLLIQATQPEHAAALVRLAQEAFALSWSEGFIQWKYFQNPAGHPYAFYTPYNGQPGAAYGNMPLRVKQGNESVMGAQAIDAMVIAPLRRRGLFYKMAQMTYAQMDAEDVRFTYAVPNEASAAGFIKKLGYSAAGYVPRYVKVLDPAGLVESLGRSGVAAVGYRLLISLAAWGTGRKLANTSAVRVRPIDAFEARFDSFFENASAGFPIATIRDSAYLTWRYCQNPMRQYVILAAERGDELVGFAVVSLDPDHKAAYLLEWLALPDDKEAALALLQEVHSRARAGGCAQVQVWMLPQHRFYVELLEYAGYIHTSARYIPGMFRYKAFFIVRPLPNKAHQPDPLNLDNWYLSLGDHDYY